MFISEFSKFHHIDYLRILTSIRTMRDETKDKLIHNSLFSSEFSKFHPWIIRPYISTSIHSFCNLSIKQRIRKVDSLISYFSEFSNFRSFFFFNFKSMKKKGQTPISSTPLNSQNFITTEPLLVSIYSNKRAFSADRETKNGQSRFSSISYLCEFSKSHLPSHLQVFNKHDETQRGQSRFPSISCSNSPLLHPPFENLEDRGNYYRQWSAAKCRHAPLVRTLRCGIQSRALRSRIRYWRAGKTFNRFRGVLHFDRYFKWPARDSFSRPSCSLRLKYTCWRAESNE